MQVIESLEPRRLLSVGDLDTTFGNNGHLSEPDFYAVTLHSILVAAGNEHFLFMEATALAEVDGNGTAVASFGQNGVVSLAGISPVQIAFQPDQKILVLGTNTVTDSAQLIRLNTNGSTDSSFGQQGVADLSVLYGASSAESMVVQSDGKIVVAAFGASDETARRMVRLNADGTVDSTFHEFDFTSSGGLLALTLQSTDKILIGGELSDDTDSDYWMVRLGVDGTIDTSFGASGRIPPQDQNTDPPQDIVLIPGGTDAFVTVGNGDKIRGYTADGTVDANFPSPGAGGISHTDILCGETQLVRTNNGQWIEFGPLGMTRLNSDFTRDTSFPSISSNIFNTQIVGAAVTSNGDVLTATTDPNGASGQLLRLHGSAGGSSFSPYALNGSTLTVAGTESDDHISVDSFGGNLSGVEAIVSGQLGRSFDDGQVSKVIVLAQGGNDKVTLALSPQIPASVSGGDGNDTIMGGDENDSLSGNAGRDSIEGGGGDDRLAGNGGRDKLFGEEGDDRLYGGAGGDWLHGGAGNDILAGGGGDDRLYGEDGTDTFAGGAGDDQFFAQDGQAESIFGDAGNDSASHDPNDILNSIEADIAA